MSKNLLIGLAIAIVVLIGGYFLYVNQTPTENNPNATSTTTGGATPNPSPSPSPTPAAQAGVPTVETSANATPSNSTAVVTGKVTPNGAPTKYWFEYGEGTALGTRTNAQAIGSGFIAISAPAYITGLKANTTYYFRLSAENRLGTVNGATYSFATNSTPPPVGTAPTTHTTAATDVTRTTANLHGQINPNGLATTYWFEYGENSDFGTVTALQSMGDGTALSPVSISLSNLKPLTKYFFRLNAQNQYGTVNGAILNFTTKGPAAPGAPTADTTSPTGMATSSVTLTGRINPNGADTDYWFEYSEDSLLGSIIGSGTPVQVIPRGTATVSVQADVTGLSRNTKYFYRVVARNEFGTVRGDVVSFKTRQ